MIVTAAPDLIPPPLIQQLKPGGKLVIPAGLPDAQTLILVEKSNKGEITTNRFSRYGFHNLRVPKPPEGWRKRWRSYCWAEPMEASSVI